MRLVIGYGNALRRDDGVALRVAEGVAARELRGVRVKTAFGLLPEHAAWVAEAERVVFVDAAVGARGVVVGRVEPAAAAGRGVAAMTHTAEPGGILGMAESVYGARVEAWLVTVGVIDLGVGEGLSEETAARVDEAVEAVVRLAVA